MAITYVGVGGGQQGLNPSSANFSFGASVTASTDVLVLLFSTNSGVLGSMSVSDNLNGAWNQIAVQSNATNGTGLGIFFVQAAVTGDPSITVLNAFYGYCEVLQFTGFTGTATFDATPAGGYTHSNSTTTTFSAPAQSYFSKEILLLTNIAGQFFSTNPPTGWTYTLSGSYYYSIQATAANVPASGSFGTATTYDAYVAGIYDKQASVSVPASYALTSSVEF